MPFMAGTVERVNGSDAGAPPPAHVSADFAIYRM